MLSAALTGIAVGIAIPCVAALAWVAIDVAYAFVRLVREDGARETAKTLVYIARKLVAGESLK